MRRDEISSVTHGDLPFHNPLSAERVDEVIERLALEPGDRALDLGCGPGELLLRIARRHGVGGVGVDAASVQIEEARRRARATGLEFVEAAADAFTSREPFAMTACVGSTHALGGLHPALERLAALTRRGGQVLLGDGFWQREPHPAFLAALGATKDELPDRTGLLLGGMRHGLTTTYVAETTPQEWDRYEWTLIDNGERDGRPEVRDWAARARARYAAPYGRDTLGFALVLMRREI